MREDLASIAQTAGRRPRVPETSERAELQRSRTVREFVFGAQDGLLTTLGIVTGVGGAIQDRATILVAGFIALLSGALSMGVGEFLGRKAEREVVEHWVDFEQREMIEKPEEEIAEQVGYYRMKGFTADEARMIVDRLTKNPEIWLHEMVRDEFGIDPRDSEGTGVPGALSMGLSFAAGAIIPIVPYAVPIGHVAALWLSLGLTIIGLFAVGAIAARMAHRNPLVKGIEIVLFGGVVFGVSFVVGHFVPPLFGR